MALTQPPSREGPWVVCPGCVRDQGQTYLHPLCPAHGGAGCALGLQGAGGLCFMYCFCSGTVVWSPEKWFCLKHAALKSEFHNAALARDSSRV